jgi:AcrR family transcriptional regulator
MPPKAKVTSADIVQTAIELIRQNGEGAVNARSIAAALNCSTQPIFSNFTTMEELQAAVVMAAYERYSCFLQNESASGKNYATVGGDALLLSVRMPKVAGVAVLCDGANDPEVRASLVGLLSAALDIPSHHIAVSPLKKE